MLIISEEKDDDLQTGLLKKQELKTNQPKKTQQKLKKKTKRTPSRMFWVTKANDWHVNHISFCSSSWSEQIIEGMVLRLIYSIGKLLFLLPRSVF